MNYYLKDLYLVGCGFFVTGIKKESFTKSYITGELHFNGKVMPALAVTYKTGKPAKLIDVLGSTPEQAEDNIKKVTSYMSQCIAHNVNGIYSILKRRFFYHIIQRLTTFLVFITCVYSLYMTFLTGLNSTRFLTILLSFALELMCFIINQHTCRKY